MEWVANHPRLSIVVAAALISGVLAVYGLYAASLLVLFFPLRVIYLTIAHPESEAALQQDKRDRRKGELEELFVECLNTGGVEVLEEEEFQCVGEEPPCFHYYPMAYGVNGERLGSIAEASLPRFGAIRKRVELLPKSEAGYFGYAITLHEKTELEVLSNLPVTYEDIASDEPTIKRIPIGKLEDGTTASISLDGKAGALLGGMPRTGKSVLLNNLIASLCRCGREPGQSGGSQRIVVCSSKILDFAAFGERVELYQDPEAILEVLQQISEEVERRKEYCEKNSLKRIDQFTPSMPRIAIILDEYAVIKMATIEDPSGKKPRRIGKDEIEPVLFRLVSQGAFSGVFTLIASQRLSTNVVSGDLRSLIAGGVLISFASGDRDSDEMIFGSRYREAAACEIPVMAKGIGYLYTEGDMDEPRMFKAAMLSPEEEERIAKQTRNLKPTGENNVPKENQKPALQIRAATPKQPGKDSRTASPRKDIQANTR